MKKAIKLLALFTALLLAAFIVTACAQPAPQQSAEPAEQPKESAVAAAPAEAPAEPAKPSEEAPANESRPYKVGVSIMDAGNTLYVEMINGVKSEFADADTVTIVDCKNNAAKQAEQVESLANAGYDGILILPTEATALSPSCDAAMEKGTHILTWVTRLENQDYHINSNPYVYGGMLGKAVGQWIKDHWPDEEVVEVGMLTYTSIPEVIIRQQGMVEEMQKIAPNAKVVAEKDAGAPDEGMAAAESFLQAHPDMKVIMGINDGGAIGAYQAVISSGKATDDYFIGGTDGINEALELIAQEGSIYRCTVSINPYDIGKRLAQNLKKLVAGETIEPEGEYNLAQVTKENVKDFLK